LSVVFLEPGDPRWAETLARLGGADVHAEPGYAAAHAARGGGAFLASVEAGGGSLAVPLVERALPGFLEADDWKDAESPYGFGGVWFAGERGALDACWRELARGLAEHRVANVFLRLHPFLDRGEADPYVIGAPRPVAFVPLEGGRAGAFSGPECATHRSQVRRALSLGFAVERFAAPDARALDEFRGTYHATLDRLGAERSYYFDAAHFQALARGLGERLLLVRARRTDVEAQALFLAGARYAHYHLAARAEKSHNAAAHVVLEAGADWAAERKAALLHLGGGMSGREDDSLLAFKRRVGRGRGQARVAGFVAAPEKHRSLVARWEALAGRAGGWFQAYRQPLPRAR
jgi:hypothetical protein